MVQSQLHLVFRRIVLTFVGKCVYILPTSGCKEHLPTLSTWDIETYVDRDIAHVETKYALPYQPMSFRELKWVVIFGIAYGSMSTGAIG